MKRMLLILLAAVLLIAGISSTVMAQEDICPCGIDEDGECMPCDSE